MLPFPLPQICSIPAQRPNKTKPAAEFSFPAGFAEMIGGDDADRRVLTAGITHELRTPLTILKGRLHAIEDRVLDPRTGETREMLRQVDHIVRMVEDLGTLAHAELGQLALEPQIIELCDIVRPIISDLAPVVEPHAICFVELICPPSSGPWTIVVRTTKGTTNAEQEAQTGRDHRQAARS